MISGFPALGEFELAADTHRQAMDDWRRTSIETVDRAILDPDAFYADKPTPFHPDQQLARKAVTVRSYLTVANEGKPVTGDLYPAHLRDRIAREKFNGRGVGSDEAFFTEIQQEATGRKDARIFMQDVSKSAASSALMAAAGEPAKDYAAWLTEARSRPGYRRDLESTYLSEWQERERQLREEMAPVRELIAAQWAAMKEGEAADLQGLDDLLGDEKDRETLLFAIGGLVKALPKEQQPSIMANLRKQFLRRDLPANLGGLQRSMKPFDRDAPLPADYLDQLEPGMDPEKFAKAKRAEFDRDSQLRDRFVRKLESIVNDEYDPIVTVAKAGSNWAAFEKGLYAMPGVAATVAVGSLPGAGQFAMLEILTKDSTDQARSTLIQGGMSEDRADEAAAGIGAVSGLIQLPMERLGLSALTQRLPMVNKAINKLTTNLATRYLARAGSATAIEHVTEMGQNLVPDIVQDIAAAAGQDMPDTQWTGPGGVFDGYAQQNLEVLGAIVPFSLIMAGGGVFQDRRVRAFAETPDIVKRAAGMSDQAIAAVNSAKGIGEQEAALKAAWEGRDLTSPDAVAAQAELTARVQAEQDLTASASDAGILPRTVRSPDGSWTLYDTATGAEIGKADDWQGAAQLATTHANFSADLDADRVAAVVTAYQAAEASGKWGAANDRPNEMNLDLGRSMTAEQAASQSAAARQRVEAQERLAGGDGSIAGMVFGQSKTELADGLYKTTNRILEGGSVLDIFHEETHGYRRIAHARGILTLADDIAVLRAVDTVLSGTTREGERLAILPENFDSLSAADQEIAVDEGISMLMESEVLRTRKGGGQRAIPAGIVSKNLSALGRLLGTQRLGKFRAFINAIREHFGLALDRAAHIKRGLADGTLDQKSYDSYLQKLLGIDEQLAYEQQARDAEAALIDGAEMAPSVNGDPFSIGRSMVKPTTSTEIFQGAQGSPDAIGPASFSIRAHHGTPHKVAKFSTANIGSGDGAQAYGWGLYFAEAPAAASIYAEGGNLYTVHLKPDPDLFLDWDSTLDEQSDQVKAALARFGPIDGSTSGNRIYRNVIAGATGWEGGDSQEAAMKLLEAGIHGVRYLDGESRADGTGTYNYVIFDEADIEILEENGQPVATAFSLGSGRLGILTGDSIRRIKDPLRRAQAMERVSRKLEDLRLEAERLELVAGSKRMKRSLVKEAAMRQALRQQELENEAWARHGAILSDDDLTKLRSQPGHAFLSVEGDHLHGRLLSKSAALKKHPDLFQLHSAGEYDGSENVSRSLFGGSLAPDQAAQEMFEAGLIKEPTPDAMWQMLEGEARHVASMRKVLESAKADLREARTVAKAETNAWLATQTAGQEATYSPRQEILRTLAALDAILSSVPPQIRGKIGGYVQAARIADPDAGLEFLRERLAKVDDELEKWLRTQYDIEFRALLDRARPDKNEPGQKPRGKITPELHALFRAVEDSMTDSGAEVEAEAVRLESLAASGDYTAEEENHLNLTASMLRLAGNWAKADAARREAAVIQGEKLFTGGYLARKIELSRQRERRAKTADKFQAATKATGNDQKRRDRRRKEDTRTGSVSAVKANLLSFEGVLQEAFGLDSPEVDFFTTWERRAANAKHDALKNKFDALDDLLASLAGGKFKGEQLRAELQDPSRVTWTDWKGNKQSVSELQGVAMTMMWRQEDGRRHMEGHVDDNGKPSGDWHYRQQDLDAVESQLSANAQAIRLHLSETYAAEWERINAVFQQNEGISLPRHKLYAPITVDPVNAPSNQMLDPTTGMVASPSFTPGSLRSRSTTAIAKPNFDADALQIYLGHVRQMEHYIAYSTFAREMVAVTNRREIRESIQETAGPELQKVLGKWLDYFATGTVMDPSTMFRLNRIMAGMMNRFAAATLVGRIGVLAIQSTQLLAAWSYMPSGAYLSRLARLMAGRLDWAGALKSDYIQRRKDQMPATIQQLMEGLRAASPSRLISAQRKLGETIAGADALFTAGTFAITYDYHLARAEKQGMTGQEATGYALAQAEAATDRVAQPTRAGTRSIIEVTSTNPAFKMLWNFASDARQKLAIAAFQHADRTPMEKARAIGVVWLAGGIVSTIIRSAMRDIRDDGEDDEVFDERNWDPWRLGLQAITGPIGGLPYLGDAIESAIFKAAGEYLPPSGTPLDNVAKAIPAAKRFITGETKDMEQALKDAEAILSAGALADERLSAGASLSHIARDLFGIVENVVPD